MQMHAELQVLSPLVPIREAGPSYRGVQPVRCPWAHEAGGP